MNSYTQPDPDSLEKTRDLHHPQTECFFTNSCLHPQHKVFYTNSGISFPVCKYPGMAEIKLQATYARFFPQQAFINCRCTECPQNPIFISVLQISLLNGSLPTTCNRLFFNKLHKTLISCTIN